MINKTWCYSGFGFRFAIIKSTINFTMAGNGLAKDTTGYPWLDNGGSWAKLQYCAQMSDIPANKEIFFRIRIFFLTPTDKSVL